MRGQRTIEFPARTLLVAACNPCSCGAPGGVCRCAAAELARYRRRLSGPLLDRFDVVCRVGSVPPARLVGDGPGGEASALVRGRVVAARERQLARLANTAARCNGDMGPGLTRTQVPLARRLRARLLALPDAGPLTGRGHDRVLKVARTIADLDDADALRADHLAEAIQYRGLDRQWRG